MNRDLASGTLKDVPAELMTPTPRKVRMTGTGWLNLIAAILFFGLGVGFAAYVVKNVIRDVAASEALRGHGGETLGQVTDIWPSRDRISYSFSVDGVTFTGTSSDLPTGHSKSLHLGDPLPIRYIPANPNVNHPAGWKSSPYALLRALWFPIFLMFFGLMFVRRFPLQRRLAMEGIPAQGCISKSEGIITSRGQRYATFTFRNKDTNDVENGRCPSDYFYKADLATWVLYLPEDLRRNEIYPFPIDFFRIEQ